MDGFVFTDTSGNPLAVQAGHGDTAANVLKVFSSFGSEENVPAAPTSQGLIRAPSPSSLNNVGSNEKHHFGTVSTVARLDYVPGAGTKPVASTCPPKFGPHMTLNPRANLLKRSVDDMEQSADSKLRDIEELPTNLLSKCPESSRLLPPGPDAEHRARDLAAHQWMGAEADSQAAQKTDLSEESSRVGSGAFIESLRSVKDRGSSPQKRLRRDPINEETNLPHGKANYVESAKNRDAGQHIKEQKMLGERKGNPKSDVIVISDEDDDPVVTYDSKAQQVCYGAVRNARIQAHTVPSPRLGAVSLDATMWPTIPVQLTRGPGPNPTHHKITACDPLNNDFGFLNRDTALGLAPLMDAKLIRVHARILMRKKKPGEMPGQDESAFYDISLNLYGKRGDAQRVGLYLSKRNIWLEIPLAVNRGIPTELAQNPRYPPPAAAKLGAGLGSNYGPVHVTRTAGETRDELTRMFDNLEKSEHLPEMDSVPEITTPLLSHQKQGLWFMINKEKHRVYEDAEDKNSSFWRIETRGYGQKYYYNMITENAEKEKPPEVLGGILADMMGLGKTLSVLALVMSTLSAATDWAMRDPRDSQLIRNSKATLLVAPLSTISNWEEQIKTHIKPGALSYYIYHGPNRTNDINELAEYDIVITTYNIVANEMDNQSKKLRPIIQTNWFRIVLDEAHMIREQSNKTSKAICSLYAQRRWAVTGTPVQNRLDDLGALLKFLRVQPFHEKGAFAHYILNPFKRADPRTLPKLRLLVDSITLRRLKDRINLPPRDDKIVRLQFSSTERFLYDWFAQDSNARLNILTRKRQSALGGKTYCQVLRAMLRLRLICAHGKDMLNQEDLKVTEGWSKNNAIDLSDDDEETDKRGLSPKQAYEMYNLMKENGVDNCSDCMRKTSSTRTPTDDSAATGDETVGFMTACFHIFCKDCAGSLKPRGKDSNGRQDDCPECGLPIKYPLFALKQTNPFEIEDIKSIGRIGLREARKLRGYEGPHTKTKALIDCLRESNALSEANPDEPPYKSVVFSSWTTHLDLIEIALQDNEIAYTRLDGKMSRPQRTAALDMFRDDPRITVILVSIQAGGVGLNLTSANHVYVMEPLFNPAAEAQAVDRVHRLGQKRPVTTTRFIMEGSIEENMLKIQHKKQTLADLSMSKGKIDRAEAIKMRLEELRSLFK